MGRDFLNRSDSLRPVALWTEGGRCARVLTGQFAVFLFVAGGPVGSQYVGNGNNPLKVIEVGSVDNRQEGPLPDLSQGDIEGLVRVKPGE